MNWSEMTPRERDALVAEKVMGHKLVDIREAESIAREVWKTQPDCQVFLAGFHAHQEDGGFYFDGWSVQHYTTDIAHAWEVVEQLVDEKRQVEVTWENGASSAYSTLFWTCSTTEPYGYENIAHHHADTAPEAICLAALRAKGVDV